MIEIKEEDLEYLGDVELPEELSEKINIMIEQADKEIEEKRIHFRWNSSQIDIVKKASALMGIPYQTYLKQAVFEKALKDISMYEKAQKVSLK
jgi:predicted DNA binding CopG/RHH family protein